MVENGSYYFYHNDHLGTPQRLTDINGNTVWSATYTAFGEATVNSASTVENNLRFPGQYFDEETGLHYNWNRYYNPKTGRYTQEDPIGFGGGDENLYRYAGKNPVNKIDPLGLAVGDWWDLPANFKKAIEIAKEELKKRPSGHNDAEDAMRHAEWNRRMVQEINYSTAWIAGVEHEIEGLLHGQPWNEAIMDLHNNAIGREAGAQNMPVNPNDLQTSPSTDFQYNPYKRDCKK